jgi:hypothetical protein
MSLSVLHSKLKEWKWIGRNTEGSGRSLFGILPPHSFAVTTENVKTSVTFPHVAAEIRAQNLLIKSQKIYRLSQLLTLVNNGAVNAEIIYQ